MSNTGAFDLGKLTAVSFAAMRLEIGTWQFIAKTKEAVSATCCCAQRQLTWEVTESGQRNKVELKWDNITSLRVTPMGPATELLEVDVQQAPALYQETSPSLWQQCHDFTGGEASCLRTHKVLFPSNTVMNLLQDLILHEPRLAALTTNYLSATAAAPASTIYPGAVIQGTNFSSLPFPPVSSASLQSLQSSAAAIGMLPSYLTQSSAPLAHLPLFSNMYNTAPSTFNSLSDQTEGFSRGSSMMSNLSCATAAQPQLSNECLSSTNSEDSLLGGLTSSPCYQSSYSGGYINPFQANSPSRLPVSPCLGNSALLEQTAAMMKAATAALHSLQSPPHLYHSPQRQQPAQTFTSTPPNQHCYAPPRVSSLPAMPAAPSRTFLPVQTAPSVASIGMQALEELMMSDSSQDSSPFTPDTTLQSVQSAPASLYAQMQASQPWAPSLLPPSSHALPAQIQTQQEATAHHSVSQIFDSITQHDATTPAPKLRALKRSVSDIPVFDCKAAAAAMAAREVTRAVQEAAPVAAPAAQQEPDFADLDLPLIDDCFLADMGSSDLESDITSGLCFEGFADFPCPGLDRSDSSSNLLAEQALQCASEDAAPARKRKGKQSKKLKARGGVAKASAQVHMIKT